jgi:predicted DNA-binding transcriptional regulator AlpA
MTGLKTDTIYTYRKRNTLPEPDQYIGRTPVWKKNTIEEWHALRSTIEREIN